MDTAADASSHDFDVRDADGNALVDTGTSSGEGASDTVTFIVSTDMAIYICSVHPNTMVGDIDVV